MSFGKYFWYKQIFSLLTSFKNNWNLEKSEARDFAMLLI
eukprot:UN04565